MQFYADQAEKGKVEFKQYTPLLLEDQERAIADENASEKTTEKTTNTSRTAQIPLPAEPIYYYHPDHLGTSTFLTDANGNAYQFFLNLPFGETMAEQLGSSYYKSPYKFNGKELDEETGLYYYGARYYNPKTSLWLSVDPLAEKGPEISPYCYAFNNPINLTDPDGRWPNFPASFQNAFKGAVNSVKQKYNETKASIVQAKDNVVRTTNQALNNGQKFVKKHKEQLVAGAKIIQKAGSDMADASLKAAAIGAVITAPAGGEGALPGLGGAAVGGFVSTGGAVLEIIVKAIAEDEEALEDFGTLAATKAVEQLADKALPGAGREASKIVKEVGKVTKEIIKNEASNKTKDIITDGRK